MGDNMAKYYNPTKLMRTVTETKPHYIVLMGGRNIGKSYQAQQVLLSEAYITKKEIIYLRREKEDIKTDLVQGYFADADVSKITEGTWDSITVYQGKIYWSRHDDDGKICEKQQFGWVHALNMATHYKSVMFPNVTDIIFEEFVPDGKPFLEREPTKLQEYVSTVFRTREGRCWLIGNTISKLNPYAEAWKLEGVNRMKPHQIDIYKSTVKVQTETGVEEHEVRTLVEACAGEGILSKMAFGEGSNQIISNEYRRFSHPCVDKSYIDNNCEILTTMYMFYQNLKFKMQFCEIVDWDSPASNSRVFWYVKPADGSLKLEDLEDERVITDVVDYNLLHGPLSPISPKEKRLFDFLARKKIFFSDDMTGTDFEQCFNAMLRR